MRKLLIAPTVILILACGGLGGDDDARPPAGDAATNRDGPSSGAGKPSAGARGPKTGARGPQDGATRADGAASTAAGPSERPTLTNPRSGARLQVYVDLPAGAGPFPAVVMMPAGMEAGQDSPGPDEVAEFTRRGLAVVRWDPDGRGASAGEEDTGGQAHQEGFREVIRYAIGRDDIADDKVGVVSYSFGITAATQALATDNPGAVFLVDWEGPASRRWIAGCGTTEPIKQANQHAPCDDESYWSVREASAWVGKLRVPYQRVQGQRDHVHREDWGHAKEMIDAAVAGGVPWVRLNDASPGLSGNQLSQGDLAALTPADRPVWMADYAEDLFMVAAGQTPPARTHQGSGATRSSSARQGERPPERGGGRSATGERGAPGERGGKAGKAPRAE